MRMKLGAKVVRKEVMKKRNTVIESFLNFDNEVSLSPSKELYFVMELHLKMTNNLFASQKPNDMFLTQLRFSPFFFSFFSYIS